MNFDEKTCTIVPDDSNYTEVNPKPMLTYLEALTEYLHRIEGTVNNIARTMFFENAEENKYTEVKDMDTNIKHDLEVASVIYEKLCYLTSRIGIDQ